jgi:hypothetical protein
MENTAQLDLLTTPVPAPAITRRARAHRQLFAIDQQVDADELVAALAPLLVRSRLALGGSVVHQDSDFLARRNPIVRDGSQLSADDRK